MDSAKVKLRVYGMTCNDCGVTVARQLKNQKGVLDVNVSLKDGKAEVEIDPLKIDPDALLRNPVFSSPSHYRAIIVER